MIFYSKTKTGFTLIELLVVVAIIGILVTFATVLLSSARARARDAKRVADIKQIQNVLELYQADEGSYPASLTVGSPLVGPTSGITYINKIPSNPLPDDSSGCSVAEYTYTQTDNGISYRLQFCLGAIVSGAGPNNVEAVPDNFITTGAAPASVCGDGIIEGNEVCDYTLSTHCDTNGSYRPLSVGVGACEYNNLGCKSDCTACVADCMYPQ
jgi:prepilin-type N-terminal cleavage/methylation domain-containing protein